MADGENGTKADAEPGAPKSLEHPLETTSIETPPEAKSHENVWTASDARGPLGEAGAKDMPTEAIAADEPAPVAHHDMPHEPEPVPTELVPEGATASEPVRPSLDMAEPKAKRSVLPIAAGLVVGAIIGAGSALALYTYETQSGGSDAGKQIAALSSRVDALQAHPPADPTVAPLKASVADLGGKVASLQQNVAALQTSSKSVAPPPTQAAVAPPPPPTPAFDPAPLQQKIAALQTSLDAVHQQINGLPAMDGKVAALAAAIAALKTQTAAIDGINGQVADLKTGLGNADKQAATTQSDVVKLQSGQKTLEGKVTSSPALAVVADSLVEQIDHGAPYAGQVAALTSLGADPAKVAVLKENADKGVPSAKALAAGFDPLVDPMVATEHRVAPNASFMDRMKSGMAGMISIRRVGDTSGDDLGSRVARIQADLTHDDVSAAYATWEALPPDAKAKSEAWGALAKTHAEAMAAAHALQSEAIKALGAKKS